ncbi:MAG: DHA2 family efflux MFS transporter permease subunit [Armatimonadota bacterium]
MSINGTARHIPEYSEYTNTMRWLILVALMLGTMMQVIDTTIVSVAIPQMMGNLGVTVDQIAWVTTGYIISTVIVLPLTGWLSSYFGRKNYLTASIIIFTVSSFLCGISWDLNSLVFFRVLQGLGGAALLSVAQAVIMEIFPPAQVGMVQAIYGLGVIAGPTIGPTLGGWITDNYNWPWIFFINVPIGVIAATMSFMFIHNSKHQTPSSRVDFIGIALMAVGLGTMQTILEKGHREGWYESPLIIWMTIISIVTLIAFVVWELRIDHPAVNLRVLKNRGLAAGSLFGGVLGFGLFGGTFVIPLFLQGVRHYTAQQSGFMLLPGALATAFVMPFVGRLVSKVSSRLLVAVGAIGFVISMFMLQTMTMDTGPDQMFWPLVIRGAAMGFLFVPLTMATLLGLRGRDISEGSGLFNLTRQIGGSMGIAVLSTMVDHRTIMHRANLVEYVSLLNPIALQRLHGIQTMLMSKGASLEVARLGALKMIDGIVHGQATIMAFEDVFHFVAMFFLCALPLLLLFNKGRASRPAGPGPID